MGKLKQLSKEVDNLLEMYTALAHRVRDLEAGGAQALRPPKIPAGQPARETTDFGPGTITVNGGEPIKIDGLTITAAPKPADPRTDAERIATLEGHLKAQETTITEQHLLIVGLKRDLAKAGLSLVEARNDATAKGLALDAVRKDFDNIRIDRNEIRKRLDEVVAERDQAMAEREDYRTAYIQEANKEEEARLEVERLKHDLRTQRDANAILGQQLDELRIGGAQALRPPRIPARHPDDGYGPAPVQTNDQRPATSDSVAPKGAAV